MVKLGKNKLKILNRLTKNQKITTGNVSNKILKKKFNAEKKVTFQKEVLLKETAKGSELVKNVSIKQILSDDSVKSKGKRKESKPSEPVPKKIKSVEKQKKRQKTQISDTKLLLKLMKKN